MAFRPWALRKIDSRNRYIFADSKKIEAKIDELIRIYNPGSVLFYLSMPHEADLNPYLKKVRKKRKVYVPFMVGDSFKMVGYRLPLKRGRFGIFEAKKSPRAIKHVDMIIVPILGVDRTFRRIGFGKGMYDRFYEGLKKKPVTIFVQNRFCYTSSMITDDYDVSPDYIITPKHFFKIKA